MRYKKFVDMELTAFTLRLHPNAKDFLFEHYVFLKRKFRDVLGHVETDYISIALINKKGEIFFLSSNPSIEQNLAEKGLWLFDGSFQPEFIYQDQPKLWCTLPHIKHSEQIKQYRQYDHKLTEGFSIPTDYHKYRAVFSFGFKNICPAMRIKTISQCEKLLAISKFSLRQIREAIPFPDEIKRLTTPKLELIINNKVSHENTSG